MSINDTGPKRRYYELWFKAVHQTIVISIREKILKLNPAKKSYQSKHLHLTWRLGFNLYKAGDNYEALKILESICQQLIASQQLIDTDDPNKNSIVHQTAGRCCIRLFKEAQSHYHLEGAHAHFQNAIESLTIDLFTMFRLPNLLLEFGTVLEYYGAFESASEVYTQILTGFPNFRGYFDALYRSSVVHMHLSDLMTEKAAKVDTLKKCVDVFAFLLEAVPQSINEVNYRILNDIFV